MIVYKILTDEQHAELERSGIVPLVPVDATDGYVHLSTGAQVGETAARHFSTHETLWMLAYDAGALGPALKWEPSRGGALFPHLYGRLDATSALWCRSFGRDGDGVFALPEGVVA